MKSQIPNHKSQGATIIVAVILLATIGFISFSLSTVLLRGIRISRALQNTELAISSANSGTEVGLYRFQRNAGGIGVTDASQANGATYSVVPDLTDDPFNFSVTVGNTIYVSLYNADDVDAPDPGYRSVVITNSAGSNPIRVDVVSWEDAGTVVCSYPSIPGGQAGAPTCNLGPARYQAVIRLEGGAGSASGTVTGFSGAGGTGSTMGIPADDPVLNVTGKMIDVQRRIRVDLVDL